MATGTVKWFNPVKGYGFIKPDRAGADIFVHISAVTPLGYELRDGEKVTFEVAPDKRTGKERAINVSVIAK